MATRFFVLFNCQINVFNSYRVNLKDHICIFLSIQGVRKVFYEIREAIIPIRGIFNSHGSLGNIFVNYILNYGTSSKLLFRREWFWSFTAFLVSVSHFTQVSHLKFSLKYLQFFLKLSTIRALSSVRLSFYILLYVYSQKI